MTDKLTPMIPYKTCLKSFSVGKNEFSLHTIEDLDHAIDQICQLLDPNDPLSEDYSPYFGTLLDSAIGLVNYLEEIDYIPLNRTHLEIGCGLALPSFYLSQLGADVIATDSHPDVPWFLEKNQHEMEVYFPFQKWNWRSDYWSGKKMDVIVGSDILYESRHPEDVIRGLTEVLAHQGRLILADPGRGYLQTFEHALGTNHFKGKVHIVDGLEKEVFILDFIKTS